VRCSSTTEPWHRSSRVRGFVLLLTSLALPDASTAQPGSPPGAKVGQVFTLTDALQYAVAHYPTVKAALEEVASSTAGVTVAKAAYLPRLDGVAQINRATVNNMTGLLLPQSVIPAISGPPLPSSSSQSAWGTAAGAVLSWEPFDFGLRSAGVRGAEATVARARAGESLTRLEVQSAVAGAFLAVVQAEQAVLSAEADLDRRTELARAARALVENELRPGAESSRADAERAAADTRAIVARQTLLLAQLTLARMLGVTTGPVVVDAANLLASAPSADLPGGAAAAHPLAQARQSSVEQARLQEQILARTNYPRLFVQSALFARGSGANHDGTLEPGANGLGFERTNWAAGVQVVFPNLFEFSSLRARRAASAATTRAEQARYDEALLLVTGQQHAASAVVTAARAVAANTPMQLSAARQSEAQASARFQAGLASIVEVADAQGLLAQAEYQDAVARVDVWRALLADAVAHGDLTPFVTLAASPGSSR
jgi:outer membrane protein